MKIKTDAKLLRIFVGESDKINAIPVYEKIVLLAKKEGLAGASVFKGIMGFGGNSRIHSSKILAISEDLPILIEIVDDDEKIKMFIPKIEEIFDKSKSGGLITLEKAEIIKYSYSKKD
jgi:PII-like signaling protein